MAKSQPEFETLDDLMSRVGKIGTPLCVPVEERKQAKLLGAYYIPSEKLWVIPHWFTGSPETFERWFMEFEPNKLQPEFIPDSCIKRTLAKTLPSAEWLEITTLLFKRRAWRCEICGGRGSACLPPIDAGTNGNWVEAHECWEFCDATNEQILVGIECVCRDCHSVKHLNYIDPRSPIMDATMKHFETVTGRTNEELTDEVKLATKIAKRRSAEGWSTDTETWLNRFRTSLLTTK